MWSRNLVNEGALAHWGLLRQLKKKALYCEVCGNKRPLTNLSCGHKGFLNGLRKTTDIVRQSRLPSSGWYLNVAPPKQFWDIDPTLSPFLCMIYRMNINP